MTSVSLVQSVDLVAVRYNQTDITSLITKSGFED